MSAGDGWQNPGTVAPSSYPASYTNWQSGHLTPGQAPSELAPGGDPDQVVIIKTMEGEETVRAGDFYLARGVKGEIWAYPKEKIGTIMIPAE